MRIVLWDTRKQHVSKDFAGGMGIGQYPDRGGLRDKLIRYFYRRDRRPVALLFAHLAAIFRQLGHTVRYTEDAIVADADLYVFNPSLLTLDIEARGDRRSAPTSTRRASAGRRHDRLGHARGVCRRGRHGG